MEARSSGADDPRELVVAPLRAALSALLLRALVTFTLAVTAVVCPVVCGFDEHRCVLCHLAVPGLLAAFVLERALAAAVGDHPATGTATAWARAWEADPGGARLALLVAAAGASAVLVGLCALIAPFVADPATRGGAVAVWLPLLGLLYVTALLAWNGACGERVARAADEADCRFRRYWASVPGRSRPA